ncbi:hypothetical protein DPMN_054990 [Dreissena polymorpha]|uniref:Uncharacterized protein n=1 Tax=Dreissena polymorpha TaxID=45954 RepID=A0A9D4HQ95_DREPO|nr:hypothetical protein DPMN_054990 [Dreissena polymorpha]
MLPLPSIIRKNLLTIVLTSKTAQPPGSHIFQRTGTIFKLSQAIIKTKIGLKINKKRVLTSKTAPTLGTSRVLTRKIVPPPGAHEISPAPGGHVFQLTGSVFKLILDIIGTQILITFYEDRTIHVTSRVLTSFFFNLTYFERNQYIPTTNLLTKFHEDQTINVASRVLTMQYDDDK